MCWPLFAIQNQSIASIDMKEIFLAQYMLLILRNIKNTQKILGANFYEKSDSINFSDNKINQCNILHRKLLDL